MFRRLTGVPYYGLSLTRDGLHMHVGDDPADVLAANPTQTWSFYIECPVIRDHQSILDPNWRFTTAPAMRTIISCIDEHNFILLTVTRDSSSALSMRQCVDYLQSAFDPLWTYNLDGGPSIALYYRLSPDDDWVRCGRHKQGCGHYGVRGLKFTHTRRISDGKRAFTQRFSPRARRN